MTKPIVALDVDGVLNPDSCPVGFVPHTVTLPASSIPDSPFVTLSAHGGVTLTVHLSPVHARWLSALRRHADVFWASTWEHAANEFLCPLLGQEPFGVIEHSQTTARFSQVRDGLVASWKLESIEPVAAGRPLVWIDDQAGCYLHWNSPLDQSLSLDAPLHPFSDVLVVAPDSKTGLSLSSMAEVDRFVARFSPSGR